ncbi:MAG: hypothetical protein JNL28_01165 [Planctomycetes bacterium]|nr:hypothetical protein [Planctomycetota bacterium]
MSWKQVLRASAVALYAFAFCGCEPVGAVRRARYEWPSGALRATGFETKTVAPSDTWIETGAWIEYHENGVVSAKGQYTTGVGKPFLTTKTGEWRFWHSNGAPARFCRYVEVLDIRRGLAVKGVDTLIGTDVAGGSIGWHPNGAVDADVTGFFIDGVKTRELKGWERQWLADGF